MTRINSNLPPHELKDKHLLAEVHELIRMFKQVHKVEMKHGSPEAYKIPKEFTLNTGHVKFFSDKLLFIWNRIFDLQREKLRRGFKVSHETLWLTDYPSSTEWYKDWEATEESRELIRERITIRTLEWEEKNNKPMTLTVG